MSWYGLLYLSDVGEALKPDEPVPEVPRPLRQCSELLGKQFYTISSEGENVVVSCREGSYIIYTDGTVQELTSQVMTQVSSGKQFSVGVTDAGHLYSWGVAGDAGQLGQGANLKKVFQPLEINFKSSFKSVSSGEAFSVALDDLGQAYAWGENFDRQLGIYTKTKEQMHLSNAMVEEMVFAPRLIPLTMKCPMQKVACGSRFTMAVARDGRLFSWGAGESGQLGTGRCTRKDLPSEVDFQQAGKVSDITCGDGHVVAMLDNGKLYTWGLNHRGQCGVNDIKARHFPTALDEQIVQALRPRKVFAQGHSSACIDHDGQLWTWGSTRNGRLLHAVEDLSVNGEYTRVTGSVTVPQRYHNDELASSKFESFAFATSRVATLIKTTLTNVWPTKGPKRTFSKLFVHGYGLWEASSILVKFSPKAVSIYNPPRSVVGKVIEAGTIVCKPPKFAEVGLYTVTVSMDGGLEFLPQSFDILIYKEAAVGVQFPTVVDLRHHCIKKLSLQATGSTSLLNSSIENLMIRQSLAGTTPESDEQAVEDFAMVKLTFYNANDDTNTNTNNNNSKPPKSQPAKSAICQFSVKAKVKVDPTSINNEGGSEEQALADGLQKVNFQEPATPATPSNNNNNNNEITLLIECEDIDLAHFHELDHGLFELYCQLSFNEQDFGNLQKDAVFSIGHTFTPELALPSCYPLDELTRLVETYDKQEHQQVESFTALQEAIDYHIFERKVVIQGQSMFPSNKLAKNTHIMTAVSRCVISSLEQKVGEGSDEIEIDAGALSGLEELLVHGDSSSTMHFTMNHNYLRQIHAIIVEQSQLKHFSLQESVATIHMLFMLETPSMDGVEKILLSDQATTFFFFPNMKFDMSCAVFRKDDTEQHRVSLTRVGGEGMPFNPVTGVVRIHATYAHESKVVVHQGPQDVHIVDIEEEKRVAEALAKEEALRQRLEAAEENGEVVEEEAVVPDEAAGDVVLLPPTYRVDFDLPSFASLVKLVPSHDAEGHDTHPQFFVSFSIDGGSIPAESEWSRLTFYGNLSHYTVQPAVPKGGAPPGSSVTLLLQEHLPVDVSKFLKVRLRGHDEHACTAAVAAHLADSVDAHGHAVSALTFVVPDAASLTAVPPVVQGKEKLYFVDISADHGQHFDHAATALLQVK